MDKLKITFSDYKVRNQIEQNEKIDKYESLDEKLKMIVAKMPIEIEGLSAKEVYEKYKKFDEEGWNIYRACEEIIEMNFYSEYIIEDTFWWFELSDGNELRYYRELYKFGNINYKWVNDLICANNAEIIDMEKSSIDYNSEEYKKYEKELYSKALIELKGSILKSEPYKRLSFIEQIISSNEIEECSKNCNTNINKYEEDDDELEV